MKTETQARRKPSILFDHTQNVSTNRIEASYKIHLVKQFSSVQARNHPSGLKAFAEVLLVPGGRDVWLGTAGTLETAASPAHMYMT